MTVAQPAAIKFTRLATGEEQHSLAKSVFLHLAPGAVVTLCTFCSSRPCSNWDCPTC